MLDTKKTKVLTLTTIGKNQGPNPEGMEGEDRGGRAEAIVEESGSSQPQDNNKGRCSKYRDSPLNFSGSQADVSGPHNSETSLPRKATKGNNLGLWGDPHTRSPNSK